MIKWVKNYLLGDEMSIAFIDGPVFVGDGRILENATVIVEGERIAKVTAGNGMVPRETHKISMGGRMLCPGFIDCHVHFCSDASANPVANRLSESAAMTALKAAQFARQTIMAGITTVRDMGGKELIDLTVRDAIRSGLILGPRMQASGRYICMTGGMGWQTGREADGPDEVRKAAREQIKAGADLVKFMATGGVMTPGVEPGNEQFTVEELSAGIQEAHKVGRKAAAHAQGTQGVLNALAAGIDSIEHGVFLNEEAISLMVKKEVPLIPTLSAVFHIDRKGISAGIPAFAVEKVARIKPSHLKSVKMARDAGVCIAMGTDAGTPFNTHGGNLEELNQLVNIGYSPMQALQAATGIAAKVLGFEKQLGTIEEGKLADLVVIQGNPLDDISLLLKAESICLVMKAGKFVKGE